MKSALAMMLVSTLATTAAAQETIDIGVLRDADVHVVQDMLYPKTGRIEVGVHLGWMAFDPLVTTPNLQISVDAHLTEQLGVSVLVGGGYGLKTGRYVELESPAYGVAPYAYRYLASVLAGVEYAPVYAKMKFGAANVVHFDVYGAARGGVTLEQSVIQGGGFAVAPTISLGLGARFFVADSLAVRLEIRDDLMVERRALTQSTHFKQNAGVTLGVSFLTPRKGDK